MSDDKLTWRSAYESDFVFAVQAVLVSEGLLSDDADDPGGLTKYGISQVYHPGVDVKSLTEDGAVAIYHRDYWLKWTCDRLPFPINVLLFDAVVNQPAVDKSADDGVIEMLQRSAGVDIDGVIGPATIARVSQRNGPDLWDDFLSRRALRYAAKSNPKYQRGLFKRLFRLYRVCLRRN